MTDAPIPPDLLAIARARAIADLARVIAEAHAAAPVLVPMRRAP